MNKTVSAASKAIMLALLFLFLAGAAFASGKTETTAKREKIVLSTPFAPLAMPMAYIVENNLLADYAESVELKVWTNPDQLRAQMAGGDVDFISIPSNTASIFFNKGVSLKYLKVAIWKVFYIVSEDTSVTSVKDLKGKTVYVPFRGDQPDLVFQTICRASGIDPAADLEIQYVPSPLDITMNLLGGKAEYGLMIEPIATIAQMKGAKMGKKIHRIIDLQEEWGAINNSDPLFPNAGVAAMPGILDSPEIVDAFSAIYDSAVAWVKENPEEAGKMAAKYVEGVNAMAFAKSLEHTVFEPVNSSEARKELETMYSAFMELNPASVGGKLPGDSFYY